MTEISVTANVYFVRIIVCIQFPYAVLFVIVASCHVRAPGL